MTPAVRSSRPPGRPPADQPVLRRDDLLEAAAESFAQGYASTSVRGLARQLGVSQSAVQHHARTKDELLRAVVDEVVVPRLAATTSDALAAAGGGEDRVRRLVRARLEALVAHGGLVLAVLSDSSRGADDRRDHLLGALLPARGPALEALAALGQSGAMRPVPATTWTVLSMLMVPALSQAGPLLERVDPGSAADPQRLLDDVAELLLLGLLPRDRQSASH